jgi:hypothetical protein
VYKRMQKVINLFVVVVTILTATSMLAIVRIEQPSSPDASSSPFGTPGPTVPLPPGLLSSGQPTPTVPIMPTPKPGARPIAAVDFGVQDTATGVVGVLAGQVLCDDAGTLRVQTTGGTLLAGILQDGGWSCQATLAQWRTTAPRSDQIGVLYRPPQNGHAAALTLVNQEGRSLALTVNGAWSLE